MTATRAGSAPAADSDAGPLRPERVMAADPVMEPEGPPWRRPGPLRNAHAFAMLISVLATVMFIDSVALPLPGPEHALFNTVSAWTTGGLLVCALLSLATLLAGWHRTGRLLIVLYGCGLVGSMATILGGDTGIDVIGATCLMSAPALIFARSETRSMAIACGLALATIAAVEWRVHFGPGPLILIEPEFMAEIRIGAVIVAACVGLLVVYLYWSAELARGVAAREQARSEALLLNVLPRAVADRLKIGEREIADRLESVTILFADIAGFTRFAASHPATETVRLLNRIFSRFDALCGQHGVEKLKTIGDGYMAVSGAPDGHPGHEQAAARLALDMLAVMREVRADYPELALRIGLNSGPAIAGVMGTRKFAYDVWGDAVNLASRLESAAALGTVTVSEGLRDVLEADFLLEPLGVLELKGKGAVPAWRLVGARGEPV